MNPSEYKRTCPIETCKNEIVPIIYITTRFGKKEFQYPRQICLKCQVELIDLELLHTLIKKHTRSLFLRKRMDIEIRDEIKKSARMCGRSVKFLYTLKVKNPT